MKAPQRISKTLALGVVIIAITALSTGHTALAQSHGEEPRLRGGRTSAPAELDRSQDESISNRVGSVIRMIYPQFNFPCYGGTHYVGALSFTGDFDYHPNGGYYFSSGSGTHKGCLRGPAGTDFDLYLRKWNGSAWVIVASSTNVGSIEDISTFGIPGYYRWQIYSFNGLGSYNFWRVSP